MARAKKLGRNKSRFNKKYAFTDNHHKKERFKIFVDGVALSLPLLVAFSFYVSTIFRSIVSEPSSGYYLSPGKTEPMIVFILLFIVAYSIFLIFEYNSLKKRLAKIEKIK